MQNFAVKRRSCQLLSLCIEPLRFAFLSLSNKHCNSQSQLVTLKKYSFTLLVFWHNKLRGSFRNRDFLNGVFSVALFTHCCVF